MSKQFEIIAAEVMEPLAQAMAAADPARFTYHKTQWGKFPDGTDNILVGGFDDGNTLEGKHVLFLASFHNNDVTLSQFYVMVMLCESFIESMTVVLPFYPTGTMERVVREGEVATASTMARLFSSLPTPGKPSRIMIYDIHTLQNRFYVSNHAVASLHTAVPLLIDAIRAGAEIDCIAFPDDGACKRFSHYFKTAFPHMSIVTCGKVRDGEKRVVTIQDGDPVGKNVVIVDDLVQTGGTLYECAMALQGHQAKSVSAFVVHAVFPNRSFTRFLKTGDRCAFKTFWVTNSNPAVTRDLPTDDVFKVLDLLPLMLKDV